MKWALASAAIVLFAGVSAEASQAQLKKANRLFKNGHYDKALDAYNDALVDAPHSSVLHYNAGDAAYMKGDFAQAQHSFEEAARSANPILRSAAHYNRGNALFQDRQLDAAIEAYKESLRVNPRDEDAKYNLGVALKAKQQKGSQGSSKESESKQGQGKDDSKKSDSKGQSQPQPAQAKPDQMSKEDIDRLLSAAKSGEVKKTNKPQKADLSHPDEDW